MGMGTPVSPATQQAFPNMYGNPYGGNMYGNPYASQSFGSFNQPFNQPFNQGGYGQTFSNMTGFGDFGGGYQSPQTQRFSDDYNRFLQSGQPFNQPVMGYNSYGQIFAPPRQQAPSFGGKGGGGFRPQPPTMGGKGGGGFRPQPPSMGGKGQPQNQGPFMSYPGGSGYGSQRPERRSRQLGLNQPQTGGVPQDYGFPTQEEKRFGGPGQGLPDFGGYFQPGKGSVASPQFNERSDALERLSSKPMISYSPGEEAEYLRQNPPREVPEFDPNTMASTQALIPATQNGVSGYYTDGSRRNFVPYSQSGPQNPSRAGSLQEQPFAMPTGGRGQSPFNPYSQQQAQLLAMQQQGQQPFVETDDDFNKRVAKRESDYYADMESIYGKERAAELRKLEGPINFAGGSTRGATIGGLGGMPTGGPQISPDYMPVMGARNFDIQPFAAPNNYIPRSGNMSFFQEGGQVPPDANMEMMIAETADPQAQMAGEYDQLIQMTMQAILGQTQNADEVIQMFIEEFGVDAFRQLRDAVLKQQAPGAQTEGMVDGNGGGMDDQVMGMIGNQRPVAVSPGEYIIPADVVSGLGDGSSKAGADILDELNQSVRMARTGTAEQPRPLMETLQQ
jgi:hypothetical protein